MCHWQQFPIDCQCYFSNSHKATQRDRAPWHVCIITTQNHPSGQEKKKKKKKTLFYQRTDLPSRVRQLGIFSISDTKNDPKNTKISKKKKKKRHFLQKHFGKILFSKVSDFGQKTADFTRFWKKFQKK